MPTFKDQLNSTLAEYAPVVFAFVWIQPNRRPILIKQLSRDGFRLISLFGDDDIGIDGKKGSPAVFPAGLGKPGTTMKFEWEVKLLDDIDVMEAWVQVGLEWTKLKGMDSPAFDKLWKDSKELTVSGPKRAKKAKAAR